MGERGTPYDRLAGSADRYEPERQLPPEIGTLASAPFPPPHPCRYCGTSLRDCDKNPDGMGCCPPCGQAARGAHDEHATTQPKDQSDACEKRTYTQED